MKCHEKRALPLVALSVRQRELVEHNLPLVHLTLRRFGTFTHRQSSDRRELFQEGCLALMEAIRSHDPERHGRFAAYAMARMRFAMSVYAHERSNLIRIPFITQRRRKKRLAEATNNGHPLESLPHIVQMGDQGMSPRREDQRHHQTEKFAHADAATTIGDLVRECYDRVMACVIREMLSAPRCTPRTRTVVASCREERWTIPEPEEQTSIRQLAQRLNCSPSCVTHCEERFRHKLAKGLEADLIFRRLRWIGRRRSSGWRTRLSREETLHLRMPPRRHKKKHFCIRRPTATGPQQIRRTATRSQT